MSVSLSVVPAIIQHRLNSGGRSWFHSVCRDEPNLRARSYALVLLKLFFFCFVLLLLFLLNTYIFYLFILCLFYFMFGLVPYSRLRNTFVLIVEGKNGEGTMEYTYK